MSVFFRSRDERRSIDFQTEFANGNNVDLFGGPIGVMRLIPLFSAHRIIIDSVASTPLHGYRLRPDGTTQRMPSQPKLLTTPSLGTPFTWKAQCVASLLSDGNAFGLVTSLGSDGWPSSLSWLNPFRCTVDDSDLMAPEYYYDGRRLEAGTFVHIPWIVPPGRLRGMSPIKAFRTALEMGQAAQTQGRDWFVGGAIPSGHLKSTGTLDATRAVEAKKRFKESVQGRDVFVSGVDWDYATIGVPADEQRFIEALKLSATQIASIYGVPPEEIGGETGTTTLTYQTLESNEIRFSSRTTRPWAVRIEETLTQLLSRPTYAKFDLDANIRVDLETRTKAHEIAQRAGIETNAEARRAEDRPPLTDAERAEWLTMWRTAGPPPPEAKI